MDLRLSFWYNNVNFNFAKGGKTIRKIIPEIVLLLLLMPALCQAIPTVTDFYEDDTIKDGDVYDIVRVHNTATVNMTGGQVDQLCALDSSTITFNAGTVNAVDIQNTSKFNLEGILSCGVFASHSSTFNVNSGEFEGQIIGSGNQINMNDGTVNVIDSVITDYTITNIYAGNVNFYGILFDRSAVLNVYGGEVIFDRDSFGDAFRLSTTAEFNVYYSDIIYDNFETEIIGYYLLDDSEFMLDQFTYDEVDQINFVPEPATFLLVGLGGLVLRKKK